MFSIRQNELYAGGRGDAWFVSESPTWNGKERDHMAYQTCKTESLRILIVDDDLSTRRLIANFIKRTWPCQIREAEDGLDALTLLLKDRTYQDLIILDMTLPYPGGGLDVLRIIRNKHKFKDLSIVACTSVDHSQQVKEIVEHGVEGYVVKPIDKQVLIQQILQALKTNS